ncbi:YdbC family protein [Brevibacillus composti]|uniref:YdbC family protein n=1 Tax=Brevibacillus composti TaxID=2796470 RepID=A0A7T5ELX8_9BACL|nr:YdbC family protein [Brevibacillus composti]QQE74982.1 YdbC family protein [Brevibacillus composti]QUO42067.1 YdbC family protein [Brevibacillus composti]
MADIKYTITQHIGILSESSKGWKKELNLISWNDREPKFDIREWSPEHEKMGKGVTLSKEEIVALRDLLNGLV